ncbi:AUGMIN subunit 4-like [Argentina anserina]|uniref:AUGMIN subunit 4-like n=1 Tax=Argentina anserina TaxID=57926 RepID=UPI00217635F5|nr:AUGMIN subunit 4-like [Potentilla anserina]
MVWNEDQTKNKDIIRRRQRFGIIGKAAEEKEDQEMLKRQQLHEQCQLHDLSQVIDHLGRHCFAPDDSLVSKSTYYDLQHAIYSEAIAMVEDYHQGWGNPPQLYETLEHLMITAEAAQKLRLLLLSKDGDIHDE